MLGLNYETQKIEDHPMLSHFVYVINGNKYDVIKIHESHWARTNPAKVGLMLQARICRGGLVDKTPKS